MNKNIKAFQGFFKIKKYWGHLQETKVLSERNKKINNEALKYIQII